MACLTRPHSPLHSSLGTWTSQCSWRVTHLAPPPASNPPSSCPLVCRHTDKQTDRHLCSFVTLFVALRGLFLCYFLFRRAFALLCLSIFSLFLSQSLNAPFFILSSPLSSFLSFPCVLYMGFYSFHSNTLLTFLQPPWCVVLGGHVALKDIAHLRDISPSSTHVQIPCGTHPTHLAHPTPHSYIWYRSCILPPSILLSIFPSILPSFTCIALICLLPPYFLFFFFFFLLSLVIVSTPDRCFVVLLKRQDSLFVPHRLCFSHPPFNYSAVRSSSTLESA